MTSGQEEEEVEFDEELNYNRATTRIEQNLKRKKRVEKERERRERERDLSLARQKIE